MHSFEVVGGTCSCLDHILLPTEQYPSKGEKTFLRSYETQGGGVSANALVFLARMGISTAFVGIAGTDTAGEYLVNDLKKNGVDVSAYQQQEEFITPQSFIIIDPETGNRTIMAFQPSFPLDKWTVESLDKFYSTSLKYLLIDTHHLPVKKDIVQWGREHDIPMVWDVGTYKHGIEELFPYMDYFIAPDDFLRTYFDKEVFSEKEMAQYLETLSREGRFFLTVITAGKDGAYVWSEGQMVHLPAFMIKEVKDSTGAGDIFHGGFVYGLLQGWDIMKTLEWAIICAGLSCRHIGGRQGLITLEEIEAGYNHYKKNVQRRAVLL